MPGKGKAMALASRRAKPKPSKLVFQFLIVLLNTDPLVWRRIQVPGIYSFWDLHVAIQDSMGWTDSHLHEFHVWNSKQRSLDILGIPFEEEIDERPIISDWTLKIADYYSLSNTPDLPSALYVYDFGDNWLHTMTFEGCEQLEPGEKYPRCLAGARACPPEDCGGVHGFENFLHAIADPTHEEHEEYISWSGGDYDPNSFDPSHVSFDNPHKRWKQAFQEGTGL